MKPAPQPEQKTSSMPNAQETPGLQSTVVQTSSRVAVESSPISSAASSDVSMMESTIRDENIVATTARVVSASKIKEYFSFESSKRPTHLSTPQHQIKETTSSRQEMERTPSFDTSKSSTVNILNQLTHAADSIAETTTTTTQSSMIYRNDLTSSSAIIAPRITSTTDISAQNPSSRVVVIEHPTFSANIMSSQASTPVKIIQTTESSQQSSSPSTVENQPSPPASNISTIHTHYHHTTKAAEQKNIQSTIAINSMTTAVHSQTTPDLIASPETTNILPRQSSSFQKAISTSTFTFASMDNKLMPTSSSHVHSEIEEIHSTRTTRAQLPTSMFESTSQSSNLFILDSVSTSFISSISSSYMANSTPTSEIESPSPTSSAEISSPARSAANSFPNSSAAKSSPTSSVVNSSIASYVMISLNTSSMVERWNTTKISSSIHPHASASVVTHTISENSTTATIQPSKTFATPVLSSSVWVPPYYHPWSNWSICSRVCGGGFTHQTRNCSERDGCGGLGPSINGTICNLHPCNGKFANSLVLALH